MFCRKAWLNIVLFVVCSGLLAEDLKVADVFADHMVLQRQKAVPVWGWCTPGEKVTVEFKGQQVSAVAGQDGKWMVMLKPLEADSKPADMNIFCSGSKKLLTDILVGEVWLCSGQSNMKFSVVKSANGKKMIETANNSEIRLLFVPRRAAGAPFNSLDAEWRVCTPESVTHFSAVAYYFGLELFNALKVPVGLIESAWGGTRIEPWTPPVGFAAVDETKSYLQIIDNANNDFQKSIKKYLPHMNKWLVQAQKDLAEGKNITPAEYPNHELNSPGSPTGLYNGMIASLVPFAIRGVIWYQGESNISDGMDYFYKMQALVKGWRKVWNEGDFPFYFVLIAQYHYNWLKDGLPLLLEAQYRAAKEINNCGFVFPGDVANIEDIHPIHKYPVGQRLAMLALVETYGRKIAAYKSPGFKDVKVDGDKLIISFENLETGLKTSDGNAPREFTIAGEDGIYYPAKAEINGKTVFVSSDRLSK